VRKVLTSSLYVYYKLIEKGEIIMLKRFSIPTSLVIIATLLLLFALVPAPVQGQTTPMLCWGVATLDDAPAPEGTIVEIYIGDDTTPTTNTIVSTHNGTYPPGTYGAVEVRADKSRYDEPLSFTVNGSPATKDGPDEGVFGLENQVVDLVAFSGPQLTVTTNGSR
jgi:hypothetical protein